MRKIAGRFVNQLLPIAPVLQAVDQLVAGPRSSQDLAQVSGIATVATDSNLLQWPCSKRTAAARALLCRRSRQSATRSGPISTERGGVSSSRDR